MPLIKKQFTAEETKIDADERTVTAIISTGSVDRDGEVLMPSGIQVENFMKSPVVLWAHDYQDTPIGKAMWVTKGTKRITAKLKFAETEKAEEVYQLFKDGFLNAFSVGFNPLSGGRPTTDEVKAKPELAEAGWIYRKWELLEFSAVPVPANPEALSLAVKSHKLELSDETLKDFSLLQDDIEETFYPANKTVEVVENNYTAYASIEDGTCTVTDAAGVVTVYSLQTKDVETGHVTEIAAALAIEKIFDVKTTPVSVEPYIKAVPFRNKSMEKRKQKGVIFE